MGDHSLVVEEAASSAIVRDVTKAVQSFARTARARPLYGANNKALIKMMDEVVKAFDTLFRSTDEVQLKIGPDSFTFDDVAVFSDEKSEVSVPFLFFRDGIRRLEFAHGVTRQELETLIDAIGQAMGGRGSMDDDIVSYLWRHEMEHLRYVTVDTTITDTGTADITGDMEVDLDTQIDAIIQAVYGASDGGEFGRAIHIDGSELDAKKLADALGSVNELAPGFCPPRNFLSSPDYADSLVGEVEWESDLSLAEQAANVACEAFARGTSNLDTKSIVEALLRMFDAAILAERIGLAQQILDWVKEVGDAPQVSGFLSEALSEARLRLLSIYAEGNADRQTEVMRFLRASGRAVVPALVALVPSLTEPAQRRAFSELAMDLGMEDVEPIFSLLESEQGFVAAEALHMLARMKRLNRRAAREAIRHPKPQVRLGLLQLVDQMEEEVAEEAVLELLEDSELRVKAEAVNLLDRFETPRTRAAIESMLSRDGFEDAKPPVKNALLAAYVKVAGRHAFDRLEEIIKSTDRRLTRKPQEELGVAAVLAIASLPNSKSVSILKKACLSRNKKVRERARQELSKLRKDFE